MNGDPLAEPLSAPIAGDVIEPTVPAPPSSMSDRERVSYELLVLANLEKLIAAQKKKVRAAAEKAFNRPGQREVAELSSEEEDLLGNVRRDPQRSEWKVTDPATLLDYCREVWPEHVVTTTPLPVDSVAPAFVKSLLDLAKDGVPALDAHGEEIHDLVSGEILTRPPGIEFVQDKTIHLVVTPAKGGPDALLRALGDNAALLGLAPRELEA